VLTVPATVAVAVTCVSFPPSLSFVSFSGLSVAALALVLPLGTVWVVVDVSVDGVAFGRNVPAVLDRPGAVGVVPSVMTVRCVGVMATLATGDVVVPVAKASVVRVDCAVDARVEGVGGVRARRCGALLVAVGERSCRSVERAGYLVDPTDGDPYPRSRYLRPHRVDDRAHGRSRGAGDDEEVGVGRGRSGGPMAPRDLGLEREPDAGAPGRRDDQHVWAACGRAEQQGGQAHRNAPSRQA
jgi:hypothetical protein